MGFYLGKFRLSLSLSSYNKTLIEELTVFFFVWHRNNLKKKILRLIGTRTYQIVLGINRVISLFNS